METTWLIGCGCKHSDVLSLAVLITRGLDLRGSRIKATLKDTSRILYSVFRAHKASTDAPHAPLAQLVEQLTLNQRVPGSSP